ncbi:MAG: ComF family protein [Clostridia bacterium]|nr:ComF family protein [Clostridia bacterium]
MGFRDLLRTASGEIAEAIFPSNIYCVLCGSLIDRSRPYALCDECVRKLHWINGGTCDWCGKALPDTYRGFSPDGRRLCYDCMTREHYYRRGWSCLTYGLHERELMMDIKYNGKGYIASKMGDVMYDRMESLIEAALAEGVIPFDAVVPVPVSRKRLVRRGYNQSELMAQQFLRRWGQRLREADTADPNSLCPRLEKHVLVRSRETVMLRSLNPEERRLVLHDAFAVNERMRYRIEEKTILLIDDIYTTGATADACSKVLLEAGASAVYLLTLCSGGNRLPKGES